MRRNIKSLAIRARIICEIAGFAVITPAVMFLAGISATLGDWKHFIEGWRAELDSQNSVFSNQPATPNPDEL